MKQVMGARAKATSVSLAQASENSFPDEGHDLVLVGRHRAPHGDAVFGQRRENLAAVRQVVELNEHVHLWASERAKHALRSMTGEETSNNIPAVEIHPSCASAGPR